MRATKIMHVTTSIAGGGAETMLCNVLERLDPSRFENVVVTTMDAGMRAPAPRIRGSASAFYDLGITAIRLRGLLALLRIIRKERPDIVQTWMHKADFFGGLVARFAAVHRVVWGIHSSDVYRAPGAREWVIRAFKRMLAAASWLVPSRIVSCSKSAAVSHQEMGYPSCKLDFICNGVDTERFRPDPAAAAALRQRLAIPFDAPVIGYVGRFHGVKDIPTLLRAAELLLRRFPGAHFVLCGDAAPAACDPKAAAAMERFPARGQLHVLPYREDIENVYPLFDVFALASTSEAFPMVLLEAMAAGKPCVSTDVGDASEILGNTGEVVAVGDPAGLADAWCRLLGIDRADRERLGREARARCEGHFSLNACVARYETLYQQLMTE